MFERRLIYSELSTVDNLLALSEFLFQTQKLSLLRCNHVFCKVLLFRRTKILKRDEKLSANLELRSSSDTPLLTKATYLRNNGCNRDKFFSELLQRNNTRASILRYCVVHELSSEKLQSCQCADAIRKQYASHF